MTTAITSVLRGVDGQNMVDCYAKWKAADLSRTATLPVWAHDRTLDAIRATETAVAKNSAYTAPAVTVSNVSTVSDAPVTAQWGDATLARLDTARAHTVGHPSRGAYQAQQIVAWCKAHPVERWGPHLGLNMAVGDGETSIDRTALIGLGWVVYPREHGWGDDNAATLIAHAHSVGLKVLVTIQESSKNYDFVTNASNLAAFAAYAAHWVDLGADAIQIGNEWNNLGVFWKGTSDPLMADRAKLHEAATNAIRAKSSSVKIVTCGWSPAAAPYDPPTATKNLFVSRSGITFPSKVNGVGTHPYNWRSWPDIVLHDGSGTPRYDWNACAQNPMVYEAGGRRPLWLSEYGGPSGGVAGTMTDGSAFSEKTQGELFEHYFKAFNAQLAQGVQIEMAAAFPVNDQSGGEVGFGVYRTDGSLKPAGKALRDFALTTR